MWATILMGMLALSEGECAKTEYTLMPDRAWYVLDDSFLREFELPRDVSVEERA